MPEESFIKFTYDWFTADELHSLSGTQSLTRKRPVPVAMVFPDPKGNDLIKSLQPLDILLGSISQQYRKPNESGVIVSLIFEGLVRRLNDAWRIIHPRHAGLAIPVPDIADLFIFSYNTPHDVAINFLEVHVRRNPPSVLLS